MSSLSAYQYTGREPNPILGPGGEALSVATFAERTKLYDLVGLQKSVPVSSPELLEKYRGALLQITGELASVAQRCRTNLNLAFQCTPCARGISISPISGLGSSLDTSISGAVENFSLAMRDQEGTVPMHIEFTSSGAEKPETFEFMLVLFAKKKGEPLLTLTSPPRATSQVNA